MDRGRLPRNVMLMAAVQSWSVVLLVVSTPILLRSLGQQRFGIFLLVSVVIGYVGFLDLGLAPALVRAVAMLRASDDIGALQRVIATAFTLLLLVGALGCISIVVAAPWIGAFVLHVNRHVQPEAVSVVRLAGLGFGVNMALVVFVAVTLGLQRFDIYVVRSLVLSTLTTVGQVGVVLSGGGLVRVAQVSVAASVVSILLFAIVVKRLLPRISFVPGWDRRAMRQLVGFGGVKFANQIASQASFQVDRSLVAIMLPISNLPVYMIPLGIAQKILVLHGAIASAFFPAASELTHPDDAGRLRHLYLGASRINACAMFPLAAVLVGFSRPILSVWLGSRFEAPAGPVLIVLAFGYALAGLIGLPAQLADATGHPAWTLAMTTVAGLFGIPLTVVALLWLGPVGAAMAYVAVLIPVGLGFASIVQSRLLHISWPTVIRVSLGRPALASIPLFVYAVVAGNMIEGPWALGLAVGAGCIGYAVLTWLFGVWTADEMGLVKKLIGRRLESTA